jgi:hypothetical protein
MCSKNFVIFIKALYLLASIFLKMASKSLKIVQNALQYWKKPLFRFKCFKKLRTFENAANHFKKASIYLQMSSKRIEIFKKASNTLQISLNGHAFKKKPSILKKISPNRRRKTFPQNYTLNKKRRSPGSFTGQLPGLVRIE